MSQESDRQKIKQIITDTIISLCKNGMSFNSELRVEALVGLTLDCSEVFLININETVARNESYAPTSLVADVHSRSVSSSTAVAEKRSRPRHELMATAQHQESETQCLAVAVQPFHNRKTTGGLEHSLPTMSAGSSKMMDCKTSVTPQLKVDPDKIRSSTSASSALYIKQEPRAELSGYEESSGEVYYDGDSYDTNGQKSYQFDNAGEGYYDQYADNNTGHQYSSDMYEEESVPSQIYKQPQAKRRKIHNPSTSIGRKTTSKLSTSALPELGPDVPRWIQSPTSKGKDSSNSGLIERALNLVHEGQLTAGVAIKLFGIPKSTFYKKLSMSNPRQQQQSKADSAFQGNETFGEYFDTEWNETSAY